MSGMAQKNPLFFLGPRPRQFEGREGKDEHASLKDLRQQRLQNPTDDLTSALVHAEAAGDRLSVDELGSFSVLLTAAGNETTRNAISRGIKLLCDYPDQRQLWQSDFDAHYKTAIKKIVRWASPVIYMRRTTMCDTEIGGQALRERKEVWLLYS